MQCFKTNLSVPRRVDGDMDEMIYPAHIRILDDGEKCIQTVAEHLNHCAEIAGQIGKQYALEKAGTLLGIVHDAGKLCNAFRNYIEKAANNEHVVRGSVNHTFTGVRLIMKGHGLSASCTVDDIALEILGFAVGAHHGLFDCVTEEGKNEFERRIHEAPPETDESTENYYHEIMDEESLADLIRQAAAEVKALIFRCRALSTDSQNTKYFAGQLARLLLSILIEADRRDTAAFMVEDVFPEPCGVKDWQALRAHADAVYQQMVANAPGTPVNEARGQIAATCLERIGHAGSVMRLNIPTGAGKTVTGLRSALKLAEEQGKAHIIYTAPLLSILEQNAGEIRRYIGRDDAVLEHHSNIVSTSDSADEFHRHELLTQNWSAPVIVTTMVQLLNAMFDGSNSSVRRFHALGHSVILIDEVQTVPRKMLTLFNLTMSFLSAICGTTFILCSATQPYLEKAERPPLVPIGDLMPYQEAVWQPFRRTSLIDSGRMQLAALPAMIGQTVEEHGSLLVVCNKKAEAAYLMDTISVPDAQIVHLSASMCTGHRRQVLASLRAALEMHRKVVCISTQVIEAGVDISFQCVIRLTAGMDSIVQAAGRCNRHGEQGRLAPVYMVHCADERLTTLPEIEAGQKATISLLNMFHHDPGRYGDHLDSDEAIRAYYAGLYRGMESGAQDMYDKRTGSTLFKLLSDNQKYARYDEHRVHYYLYQAFKTASRDFEVFETAGKTVIVPWGEGQRIIEQLEEVYPDDYQTIRDLLTQARPYTVTVYDHQLKKLREMGGIIDLLDGAVCALGPQYYSEELGLTLPDHSFLEV